jgi:hypothetical protein
MLVDYPEQTKNLTDPSFMADVANHCKNWSYYEVKGSDVTSTHEGTHGIHAQLRNELGAQNGFYLGYSKAFTIASPKCRKSDSIKYIPEFFRKMRFSEYVSGQQEWDDTPLYIYDEWGAYINGALAANDLYHRGKYQDGQRDNDYGPIEFVAYGIAVAMAAQAAGDLSDELKQLLDIMIKRSFNVYYAATSLWEMGEKALVDELQTGPNGETYRQFLKSNGLEMPMSSTVEIF